MALAGATDAAAHRTDPDALPELASHAGEEAAAWKGEGRELLGHLAALYAIEAAQPAISRVKADGLREFYGFGTGPATAYLDLHAQRDAEHAADGRASRARPARQLEPARRGRPPLRAYLNERP